MEKLYSTQSYKALTDPFAEKHLSKVFHVNQKLTRIRLCLFALLWLVTLSSLNAQVSFPEVESNDHPVDAGVHLIYQYARMTGVISVTDNDYWKIAKRPGATGQANLTIRRISGSPLPPVFLEKRSGSYDGTLVSSQLVHSGSTASGFYNQGVPINYDGGDFYYLLRMGNGASAGAYTYDLFGFSPQTCTTAPSEATSLSTTPTASSITLDAFNGSTANRFLVKINTVNSFTGTPAEGQILPASEGLAYSGSGEQIVYVGSTNTNTPNVTISGLTAATEYYFQVYGYTDCTGYFKINAGTVLTAPTCGAAPNAATALSVTSENNTQVKINSITTSNPSSVAYVIKANTVDSFTAPANGAALPTANATYISGEQVVYAGTSPTPGQLISGLIDGTQYHVKVYIANVCDGNYYFESTGLSTTITPTCAAPNSNSGQYLDARQTSPNSLETVSFTGGGAGNNADGRVVYISDQNSFNLPTTLSQLPTASTDYSGLSGQQPILATTLSSSGTLVTGLSANTTYYFSAVTYKLCNGVYYFYPTALTYQISTCNFSDNLANSAVFGAITTSGMELSSFTGLSPNTPATAPDGYVIKMNSVNSFTPVANGSAVPSANTTYTGSGEQVIYSGNSNTPNLSIAGLSAGTDYYFAIYAYYNGCRNTTLYQQTGYRFSKNTKDNVTIALAGLNPGYTGSPLSATVESITRTVGGTVATPTPQIILTYEGTNGATYGPDTAAPTERGEYTVTASVDPADQNFQGSNAATLTIGLGTADLSSFVDFEAPVSGPDQTLDVSSAAGINVSFQLVTANTEASLNGNLLTPGNVRGTETLRVTVADANYNASSKDVTVTIGKANPVITWADPADIEFTTALDATQLNAVADVPGTFTYFYGQFLFQAVPGQSKFSAPGAHQLKATFTPADPTSYNTVSKTVSIIATKVNLVLRADDIVWAQGEADPVLTYSVLSGELAPHNVIFVPLKRVAGTIPGDYAIQIDDTAVPNPPVYNDFFGSTLSCSGGICITDTPSDIFEDGFLTGANREANYNVTFTPGTFTIVNKTLATVNLTAADLIQTYDGSPKGVTVASVVENSSGNPVNPVPAVTFSYKGTDRGGSAYGPSTTAPVNAGTYTVTASVDAADPGYVGFTNATLTINPAPITSFTARNLNHVADGTPKPVTVISTPAGATINPTYFGRQGAVFTQSQTPPSAPGTYTVRAGSVELSDLNFSYAGSSAFWNMVIHEKTPLTITFDPASLTSTYDGTPHAVSVSAISELISGTPLDPANWPVINITYDGSATGPTNSTFDSGSIWVEATVDPSDPNYSGSSTGDMEINQALSNLVFPTEEIFVFDGTPKASTATNTGLLGEDLGLLIEYASNGTNNYQTTPPTAIGTYQVRAFYDEAYDNYNYNYLNREVSGTLIIRDKLTVTASEVSFNPPASLVYDASEKVYTVLVSGTLDPVLPDGDLVITYAGRNSTVYANSNTAPTMAGDYTVTATVKAANTSYTGSVLENFTITPVALTITADAANKVYGDADPALTYQLTSGSLASGDAITGTLSRDTGEDAGNYTITSGTVTAGNNYNLNYVPADLTIDKRDLTVNPAAGTAVYGEVARTNYPVTYTGFVNGEDESVLNIGSSAYPQVLLTSLSTGSFYSAGSTAHIDAITIDTAPSQVTATNYNVIFGTGDLTVTARPIAINADSRAIIYGEDANTGNTAVAEATDETNNTGLAPGETIADFTGTLGFANIAEVNAGTHQGVILPSGLTNSNYTITYVAADLTINPLAIEVTADASTKTYGDGDPELGYQVTLGSLVGNDKINGSLERSTGEAVGLYPINQGTLTAGSNYVLSYQSDNLMISKREIQITAENKSKIIGTSEPALTYLLTSGSLAFSDAVSGALARETGEEIGFYAINQGTLSAGANYNITYVPGTFEVMPKSLQVIQFDPLTAVTYGDADFNLTASASSDLAVTYTSSDPSVATVTGNTVTIVGAGTTNITASQAGDAVTEEAEDKVQTLPVQPRIIELAAEAQSKTYGDSDPELTYQVTSGSLINGENFTGSLSRVTGENVGTYAIEQGTLTAGSNYSLVFSGSDLTIGQRSIEITADAKTKVYGDADPTLTFQITNGNLVGADAFTGTPGRAAGENAGTYAINQGNITAGGNYMLRFVSNDLSIDTRDITVTANAGQSKVYGDSDPVYEHTVTSGALQFSDALSGTLSRSAGENTGTYALLVNTLSAGLNYKLSYVANDFSIAPRPITLTADAQSKAFGAIDPTLTYQITTGMLVGADLITGAQERVTGETAGDYPINQGTLMAGNNYDLTYVPADLTIEPVPALHFNGLLGADYDYIEVADNESLDFTSVFTFESWVKFDQITRTNDGYDWQFLFAKSRYNESYGLMLLTDGPSKILRFYHAGFGNGYTDYIWNSLVVNDWNHVAVSLNDSRSSIMINGVEVASQAGSGSLTPNDLPFRLGAGGPSANIRDPYPLLGVMDEVRVWDKARTPTQITSSMLTELSGQESGLVLYYNFNEGIANGDNTGRTSVPDGSTMNNTGTLHSFALTGTTGNYVDGSGIGVKPGLPQTITFNALPVKTYGDTNFTVSATGGDSGNSVTFSSSDPAVATVDAITGEVTILTAGTTNIIAAQGGNAAYTAATDVSQSLTVSPRQIKVEADAQVKVYGDSDPILSYQLISGTFINGDGFSGVLSRAAGENVGIYAIEQGTLTGGSNYNLVFTGAGLTVSTRDIEVTADAQSKNEGEADPTFTYQLTNGSLQAGDQLNGSLSRATGEEVGDYAIQQGTLTAGSNYNLSFVGANLSIIFVAPPAKPAITHISDDTGVSNLDGITSDRNLLIHGTAEANMNVDVFSPGGKIGTVLADVDGAWMLDISRFNLPQFTANMTAEAFNGAGKRSEPSDPFTLTIDFTAPAKPAITGISDDTGSSATDGVTSDRNILVHGTAEPGANVDVFSPGAKIGTVQADANGDWMLDISRFNLPQFTANMTAEAFDLAGNRSTASDPFTLTIDFTAPDKPAITRISDDTGSSATDGVTSDRNILVYGTAEAGANVDVFSPGGKIGTVQADASGNWMLDISRFNLPQFTAVMTAEAFDLAGNRSAVSDPFTLTIDFTTPAKPAITRISDDTGSSATDGVTSDRNILVHGTAEAGVSVDVFSPGGKIGTVQADANGDWVLDISRFNLPQFTANMTAEAFDLAGNRSAASDPFTLTIDFTAPAKPAITRVSDDTGSSATDGVTSDRNIVVHGTAEAGANVDVFSPGGKIGTILADANGDWMLDISRFNLPQFTSNMTAEAVDLAGNRSATSDPFTLTIDFKGPGVTIDIANNSAAGYLINAIFDEEVSGLTLNGITVAGGTASTLTQTSPTSYSFLVNSNGNSADVTVNANAAEDLAGNGNTVSNQLSLGFTAVSAREDFTDLQSISKAEEVNIYPNPASKVLTIDLSELSGEAVDVRFVNAAGVSVFKRESFTGKTLRLDVSGYRSGLYIVQIFDGTNVVRKKVMVRK